MNPANTKKREYYLLENGKCPVCRDKIMDIKENQKVYKVKIYIEENEKKIVMCRKCRNLIIFY